MINTVDDILAHLEKHIHALGLYSHPLYEAAISTIAFIQANYSTLEVLAPDRKDGAVYRALRDSQDVLKYALYGIFTSCPSIFSSKAPSLFGPRHFEAFRTYSMVHDCVQSVRHGLMDYTVDTAAKKVTFVTSGSSIIDGRRTRRELDDRRDIASGALDSFSVSERTDLRTAFSSHFEKVRVNRRTGALQYEITEDMYKLASLAITKEERFLLVGPKLPDNLHMGQFTTEDFIRYWRALGSLALVHDLSYKFLVDGGVRTPPVSSVLLLETSRLQASIVDFSKVPVDAVREISRDLTYNPTEVGWTEPQYQPLLPVRPGFVAIAPLIVGSNNYERNYAALVEKLPWRKEHATLLKSVREQRMIDRLVAPIQELGLGFKPRVTLRQDGAQVGDIDLAIWQESSRTIVLGSLKWHYGPDSVAEVMNHAKRYQEANAQERKILDFAIGHPREVLTSLSLREWQPDRLHFLPLIIYQEDLPLEKDRVHDLPAANVDRFIKVLRQKSGNLQDCHDKLIREYTSFPAAKLTYTYSQCSLGGWRFELPTSYADET
jgi:hypothetical protein